MKNESTKDKVLKAARTLFVQHGFSGTSIGNIAKLAAINHSLIFHHFKSKELLWQAVKQSIVQDAEQTTNNIPDTALSFAVFLRELFVRNMDFYRNNSDLIRMINWQRLEPDASHNIGISKSADMDKWMAAFSHYQQQGDIQAKLKPEWIITLILSIISSAALDPNVFINDQQSLDEYVDFCIESLKTALK